MPLQQGVDPVPDPMFRADLLRCHIENLIELDVHSIEVPIGYIMEVGFKKIKDSRQDYLFSPCSLNLRSLPLNRARAAESTHKSGPMIHDP